MLEFVSKSVEETEKIAEQISKKIKKGDVILLFGNLGAGKTTFTKSLCHNLGVDETVTSPTFTILNEHKAKDFIVYHFDMYRVESLENAYELGFDEIINGGDGVCVVEWPEMCSGLFPENCVKIYIEYLGQDCRKFKVEGL